MLRVRIHRGTHQIGGCATEIECDGERILIDLGANLPGTEGSCSDRELLDCVFGEKRDRKFQAVLFSHYHGDHLGLYREIPEGIPMYAGPLAKKILGIVAEYADKNTEKKGAGRIGALKEFRRGTPIKGLSRMKITPYSVDHSAVDAYCFLIEAEGKKILFTGDFRDHGIASERQQFWRVLEKYVKGPVDLLITEGTMLSREGETAENPIKTEDDLGKHAAQFFSERKYHFVLASSANLDSIMEFYQNTPEGMAFACDQYQARILLAAMESMGKEFWQYRSKKEENGMYKRITLVGRLNPDICRELLETGERIHRAGLPKVWLQKADPEIMKENGFVMMVRPNHFYEQSGLSFFEKTAEEYFDVFPEDSRVIYSLWKGYLSGKNADPDIQRFLKGKYYEPLHTSGHASVAALGRLMEKTDPAVIVPMHTEMADEFGKQDRFRVYRARIRALQDGEVLIV